VTDTILLWMDYPFLKWSEKKNLNLEIFSTDIVEYISIDKVYSGNIYGDFAGGNVDIISKDYKGKGFFKIDIGSKVNTNAIAEDNFKLQKGFDGFGFTKSIQIILLHNSIKLSSNERLY
jgi:hypothetical protein